MHRALHQVFLLTWIVAIGGVSTAAALPLTIDDFEDGTTMGWFVPGPSPVPPTNVANGGPGGAGDNFLQLQALGNDQPGGRLSVLNESQWTGDFRAAGIKAISMDVFNMGPDDLSLRLLFEDFDGPGPPVNLAVTLADVLVPAMSGWMTVVFDLSASNLFGLVGSAEDALANVDVLRLFHNPDPIFFGPPASSPPVNATLGVDNITAIPEPASAALLLLGVAALVRRNQRRKH